MRSAVAHSPLPVDAVRDDVRRVVASGAPLVLAAPTGSGKSTRLPLWLQEDGGGRVLVVEPRRVACTSLATFLARQSGTELGERVGYAVRFDTRCDTRTEVVFATTGVALRWLADPAQAGGFDTVLVDEFHERRWETDLLVALVSARKSPRLAITSATIDASSVADAVGGVVVEAEGRTYPVEIEYAASPTAPSGDALSERVSAAVRAALAERDGDVLVFLPGVGEIRACGAVLGGVDADVVEVHGGVAPAQLARVFAEASDRRRVYLSTNVAETSVTLPGVRVVIDSGLVRTKVHRGSAGRSVLALEAISAASADQRAGRAGRVAAGTCVRLWSARASLRAYDEPEVSRLDLDELLGRAAACGVDAPAVETLPWVTPPPPFALEAARGRLERLGVLTPAGGLSATGRRAIELPLSAHESILLAEAEPAVAGDLADLLAVAGNWRRLLDASGDGARGDGVREARRALFDGVEDDVGAALRVVRSADPGTHGVRPDLLREARRVARQVRDALGVGDAGGAERARLIAHVLERWPEGAYVARQRALKRRVDGRADPRGEPWASGQTELKVRLTPWPATRRDPVAGVVFDQAWLGAGSTSTQGRGGLVLACELSDLAAAELGDVEVADVRRVRTRRGTRVEAMVRRTLGGVVLGEATERLSGGPLRDALVALCRAGTVWPGAYDRLLDALHVWAIARRALQLDGEEPPSDADAYLRETLEALGLEQGEDIDLVEAEDLVPNVAERLNAATWDVDDIARDFPRVWTWEGARYTCEVRFAAGRVVLEAANKAAKRASDPPARVLPGFRGSAVELVNGSRRVRLR